MASSPSELTLECKPNSYSTLLKAFGDQTEQTQKLEDFLARLEEERLKIEAFKRELPLCMQLLNSAVEASRQQLEACQLSQGSRPVLEEFIPIKTPTSQEVEKASSLSEKANWMTSAQLWSPAVDCSKHQAVSESLKDTEQGFGISPKLGLDSKLRNGGAFLPFSKERNGSQNSPVGALPDLALASADKEMEEKKSSECEKGMGCLRRESFNKGGVGGLAVEQVKGAAMVTEAQAGAGTTAAQTHRKARRCWSPDLHRRFVNALQFLGGSHVATPKQIREQMKVDGLTNDEVKSHLQKYRLHTRRPSPAPQASTAPAPHLVVLGGIWVPPEYATSAAGGPTALYGAHPGTHVSTHYSAHPVAQEFYPGPLHHPNIHHFRHPYKASSPTHSSPESDVRGAGDRSESIEEEGKSESSSWKVDSGDNKGLVCLKEEGEESNGSEITLKF